MIRFIIRGYPIYYKDKLYLRPKVLTDNLRFASGDLFNERDVQQTYSSFGRLSALKYTKYPFIESQSWRFNNARLLRDVD